MDGMQLWPQLQRHGNVAKTCCVQHRREEKKQPGQRNGSVIRCGTRLEATRSS